MDLAFVTSNPGKVREAREILRPFGITVRPVRRVLPEPQADDLSTVVRAKLRAVPPSPRATLVEDSGIFLDDLGGFPGVYSAYAFRTLGLSGLLRLLPGRGRRATFRTVAGIRSGAVLRYFVGECRGRIAPSPRGRHGFGFDPIFVPDGERRTFGEMEPGEKLAISHRGRALTAAGSWLVRGRRG